MKYRVSGTITISVFTDVEAASEQEARDIAEGRGVVGLCWQCCGNRTAGEEWVTSGELDGDPEAEDVEEIDE